MATKLKNLRVRKVDFVPEGANQEAHVLLYKNREGMPDVVPPAEGDQHQQTILQKILSTVGVSAIGKAFGLDEEQIVGAIRGLAKEAETFDGRIQEVNRERIYGEIWDTTHALSGSLCSIIQDDVVTDKAAMMARSLEEFTQAMQGFIATWAGGIPADINKSTPDASHLELLQKQRTYLDNILKARDSTTPQPLPINHTSELAGSQPPDTAMKGDMDMTIDKSKMTPEELTIYEALEKKYGLPEEGLGNPPPAEGVGKAADPTPTPHAQAEDAADDLYKGLHPTVQMELERLRKMADSFEERELLEVAKKYEITGRKPEELVPTLKALKAAGGDAYQQMIAVLDESAAAMEKSGLFREIGKAGSGTANAWEVIEKHADEIQKASPALTRTQAIDSACQQHPELVREYEKAIQ